MVTSIDQIIARSNATVLDSLKLITAPAADAALVQASEEEPASPETALDNLTWLYEFEQASTEKRTSKRGQLVEAAVDTLLATY